LRLRGLKIKTLREGKDSRAEEFPSQLFHRGVGIGFPYSIIFHFVNMYSFFQTMCIVDWFQLFFLY